MSNQIDPLQVTAAVVGRHPNQPSPLCDLDEKKFPHPNHLHQLLRLNNNLEQMQSTVHQPAGGAGIQVNGAPNTAFSASDSIQGGYGVTMQQVGPNNGNEINLTGETPNVSTQQILPAMMGEKQQRPAYVQLQVTSRQGEIKGKQPIFRNTRYQRGRQLQMKTKGIQSSEQQVSVKSPRLYQMELTEEVHSFQPAVVLRLSSSPPAQRGSMDQKKYKVKNQDFDSSLHIQGHQKQTSQVVFQTRLSSQQMQRDITGWSAKPTSPRMKSPPEAAISSNQSSSNPQQTIDLLQSKDPQKNYNRTLMSQRFSNRQISFNIAEHTMKYNESQKETSFLPRLSTKGQSRRNNHYFESHQVASQLFMRQSTNILVQELKGNVIESGTFSFKANGQRPNTNSQTHRATDLPTFDANSPHRYSFALQSSGANFQRGESVAGAGSLKLSGRPLIDNLEEYEVLKDDQCINNNSYNIVNTNKNSVPRQSKAIFKVVSPKRKRESKRYQDDSTELSIKEKQRKKEISSPLSKAEADSPFYSDGTIKTENLKHDDENDGFRDFIILSDYYKRFNELQQRYGQKMNSKKFLRRVLVDDLLIVKQIYPRMYSIKNTLKGTIEHPDVEFNPSSLTQHEIFIVKTVSYLVNQQFDNALFFLDQGISTWPQASFEFKFNKGLLYYLKGEYRESEACYRSLLHSQFSPDSQLSEQETNMLLSIQLNLALSLLQEMRVREVLILQQEKAFIALRMSKNSLNIKIQQIFNYCAQQLKKLKSTTIKEKDTNQSEFQRFNSAPLSPVSHQLQQTPQISTIQSFSSSSSVESDSQWSDDEPNIERIQSSPLSNNNTQGSNRRKSLSSGRGKKAKGGISYAQFKKRGGHNFPLKNIKQLGVIRAKKMEERKSKAQAAARSLNSRANVFLNSGEVGLSDTDHPKKEPQSPKTKINIQKGKKAQFFNIENIQDTRSPDYVMSMTEIISRLSIKDEIQKNKALYYQLQQLDEVVKQGRQSKLKQAQVNPEGAQASTTNTVPFPYEMTDAQKRDQQINGSVINNDQTHQQSELTTCIKNLEELRLGVTMEFGGEFQKNDPVQQQYKIICNSIYSLLKEEDLVDLLSDAQLLMKNPQTRRTVFQKVSVAKEILLSALLKRCQGRMNLEAQANDQLVEIELVQDKVRQLKDIMIEERSLTKWERGGVGKNMDYMDKVENEIKKLLVIARKKEKERERQQKQESEDRMISINPDIIESTPDEVLIATKSLASLLKRRKFQEMVSDRFKVDKKKYKMSIIDINSPEASLQPESLTQQVLKKFLPVDPDQYSKMLERTQVFLRYIFDNYGAFFIANQTYCMTEILDEDVPPHIRSYFDHTANVLTTIPMNLKNLADACDDNRWSELNKSEFIYNKTDILQQLVSQGLRQPKVMTYLGLEKHEWLVEVTQKFNMLAVLNSICREGIKMLRNLPPAHSKANFQDISLAEDPDAILLNSSDSNHNLSPLSSFIDKDSLNAIKDQYARLKYQGLFNSQLVDKLIGKNVPMVSQFNFATREQIYRRCHLRQLVATADHQYCVGMERFSKDTVIVILNGNIHIQEIVQEVMAESKDTKASKPELKSRKSILKIPLEPEAKIQKQQTKWVLSPGMAVPVQFLHWMSKKNSQIKLILDKDPSSSTSQFASLDYLEIDNKSLSDLVYSQVYQSLIKKVEQIQNVDLFNGDSPLGDQRLEKLSPQVMFVMAALFKVQVFKMSELVTSQDEIPKSMFVILEGQAKAVYEDKLERKGEVCPYSRRSIRTDLPKELRFGMVSHASPQSRDHSSGSSKSPKRTKSRTRNGDLQRHHELSQDSGDRGLSSSRGEHTSAIMRSPRHSITFQNLVYNQEWIEHQPTKTLSFKHLIEFGLLTEGSYVASRVFLDEGALRTFIRTSHQSIQECMKPPQYSERQTLTQTMKAGFIKTLGQQSKDDISEGENEDSESMQSQLSALDDPQQNQQQVPLLSLPQNNAQDLPKKVHRDQDERDFQTAKDFLMKSQLSIVVVSRQLQAMVIYKRDKAYFNEPVKKLITEMIQDKNFLDHDRPIQKTKEIDFIRTTQKQWEQYKYKYEEHSLRESFHQKYEQFPR